MQQFIYKQETHLKLYIIYQDLEPLASMCSFSVTCDANRAPAPTVLSAVIQAAWRIPGHYLVMLRPGTHESQLQRTIRRLTVKASRRGHLLEILQTFSGALHGFLVKMSSDVLPLVTASPQLKQTKKHEPNFSFNINKSYLFCSKICVMFYCF